MKQCIIQDLTKVEKETVPGQQQGPEGKQSIYMRNDVMDNIY